MTIEEFLRDQPPTKMDTLTWVPALVDTEMYCQQCDGRRSFKGEYTNYSNPNATTNTFAAFYCKNCEMYFKIYSLKIKRYGDVCEIYKYGEYPPFGPITPDKVLSLFGSDRDLFLKGRRAETQGLGIGAFAYYRRVLENQKNRIIDEIISVIRKTSDEPDLIKAFEAAKTETQFSKAIGNIKDALPAILLIDGDNPLTILHSALSKGLHAQTDDECLELATSIREVLFELSERISHLLKDKKGLKEALSNLQKPKGNMSF